MQIAVIRRISNLSITFFFFFCLHALGFEKCDWQVLSRVRLCSRIQNEVKLLTAGLVIMSFDLGGALHTYFAIKLTKLYGCWHANCVTVLQCFEPLDDVGVKPCVVLLTFCKFYDPFNKKKPISTPFHCMHVLSH